MIYTKKPRQKNLNSVVSYLRLMLLSTLAMTSLSCSVLNLGNRPPSEQLLKTTSERSLTKSEILAIKHILEDSFPTK